MKEGREGGKKISTGRNEEGGREVIVGMRKGGKEGKEGKESGRKRGRKDVSVGIKKGRSINIGR